MALNKEKFIDKYADEGLENVNLVENLVFNIKDGATGNNDLAALLRALHTLKGTSRMLEFKNIENLSHSLESVFISFREQKISLSENAFKIILKALDTLKSGILTIKEKKEDSIVIEDDVKSLALLASGESNTPRENTVVQNHKESGNIKTSKKTESIRLSIDKINAIIKSIASLQSLEITAKSISRDFYQLNRQMKEFSSFLKENKYDPALTANFRKLERFSERLNTLLKNYSIDTGNSIRTSYDSVISLRTIPISTIFETFPRYVYELSQELGKKVQFSIKGKENEIDKNIIESLADVFMHIIRNALDHGIETPQERLAAGKKETGILSIACSRESGNMKIVISDDGRGINLEKIRQKAVLEGFVTEAAASTLTKEDLTNYIFHSGFSTSETVNNISGRGVGMDVVRDTVESLKGSVFIDSIYGYGTAFTIIVPLSIASLMGFPVESGGLKFIIPATFVETILLLNREDILTVIDKPEIKYNDRIIKLYYLNNILQIDKDRINMGDTVFVVIIRSYDDIAAIAVDNINSMRSVILSTMPAFMEIMPVFSGIVLNEDYEMISVLHIPAILKLAKHIKTLEIRK
jgi:chemotaxis protein histidine kinase CheA